MPVISEAHLIAVRRRITSKASWLRLFDPRYTFQSFVEGASNRVALAAARAIAENGPQSVRFNPLFVHANVGLGKTHLLQAIANAATRRGDQPRVVYLTAEYFMWRFATAIRDNQALDFKENLRGIDILIIDDMQFLQGKSIQQEFCHLLNALIDSARQVIVAADRPAFELESLDARVRSRLAGGVAIEMAAPDFEMRKEILTTRTAAPKLEDPSFAIDDKVVDTIARRVIGSGRDLEGAFNQIAFRHAVGQPLSADHLDDLLNSLTRTNGEKRIRIEDILKFVSRHYNISRTDILSARRTRTIVRPRQIAMYLAKTHDAALAAGDRRAFRRPRPHHGPARGAQDRGRAGQGREARRGARRPHPPHDRGIGRAAYPESPRHAASRTRMPAKAFQPVLESLKGSDFRGRRLVSALLRPNWLPPMRIIIERSNLLKTLGHVHRVVERRNTIPILSNVLVKTEDGALRLKATDLDLEITETVAANGEQEGATTVPAHLLYDIVRKLSDGSEVKLATNAEGSQMTVTSGRSNFRLQCLPESDFPDITAGTFSAFPLKIAAASLGRLVERTQFAISTEETRYYLNGIFLHAVEFDGKLKLRSVATDGHRLARAEMDAPTAPRACPASSSRAKRSASCRSWSTVPTSSSQPNCRTPRSDSPSAPSC